MNIWEESHRLEKARAEFQKAAMHDYNRDIYYPAMTVLREKCAEAGHSEVTPLTRWHDNGIGWSWRYCTQCAERLDITGPES